MPKSEHSPMLSSLGKVVAGRRLAMNMTQLELAQKVGLTRGYLSDVERGLRNITICTLDNIAEALGSTPAELLRDSEAGERAALKSLYKKKGT